MEDDGLGGRFVAAIWLAVSVAGDESSKSNKLKMQATNLGGDFDTISCRV